MTTRVTVAIVNWNGLIFLKPCLLALASQEFRDFEVIVVDNGSSDGSVDLLKEEFEWVKLIENSRNVGFAKANNQAIRASSAPFIATLNNDTQPEPSWLQALVEAMEANPRAGACASKMLFADRPDMINSAGIAIDRAGISWDRLGGHKDNPEEKTIQNVFGACAGAALYRRTMFDEIGLFDEDFFAYLEDVDLAWRAKAAGWEALYVPEARVTHHHSGTLGEGSRFKSQLLGRNKVWLLAKNYPWPHCIWYGPIVCLYDIGSVFAALLQGNRHPLVGRLRAFENLLRFLRKRTKPNGTVIRFMDSISFPWTVLQRYQHLETKEQHNRRNLC